MPPLNFNSRRDNSLPEVDDRYHLWRIPLLSKQTDTRAGECVIDARSGKFVSDRSTSEKVLQQRLKARTAKPRKAPLKPARNEPKSQSVDVPKRDTIVAGRSEDVLRNVVAETVDLIFTSPPYYNARPEYTDYTSYEDYLAKMREVIRVCHRVLNEGRFFVINVAPVLIRRTNRNSASRRIAGDVPPAVEIRRRLG